MKFLKPFIALLTTSTVYSISLDGRVIPKISENGTETESMEGNNAIKCNSYVTDCLPLEKDSYSEEKIDALCNGYNSKVCQNFYQDPVAALEECEKIPYFTEKNIEKYYLGFLNDVNAHSKLYCQKNENNKYCPLNVLNLFRGSEPSANDLLNSIPEENDFENAVNETCKSKSCYDAAIEFFTSLNNTNDTSSESDSKFSKLKKLSQVALETLNEETCKQQADASAKVNAKANDKTDANSSRSVEASDAISNKRYSVLISFGLIILATLF